TGADTGRAVRGRRIVAWLKTEEQLAGVGSVLEDPFRIGLLPTPPLRDVILQGLGVIATIDVIWDRELDGYRVNVLQIFRDDEGIRRGVLGTNELESLRRRPSAIRSQLRVLQVRLVAITFEVECAAGELAQGPRRRLDPEAIQAPQVQDGRHPADWNLEVDFSPRGKHGPRISGAHAVIEAFHRAVVVNRRITGTHAEQMQGIELRGLGVGRPV